MFVSIVTISNTHLSIDHCLKLFVVICRIIVLQAGSACLSVEEGFA